MVESLVQVENLCYTYPESAVPAISGISLSIHPGECLCITGHSGSGKSTLLLAMKGLLHQGTLTGEVRIRAVEDPDEYRDTLGLVFQNAETQTFCSIVVEEVAFGPENICVPLDEMKLRVRHALDQVKIYDFRNRNVERLSAGQKHRVAIASVLSMNPRVLMLDEPTSQLDGTGKEELAEVLGDLKEQGYAIVIAEHNIEPFMHLVDRYVMMQRGKIIAESDTPPQVVTGPAMRYRKVLNGKEPAAVRMEAVSVSYPGGGEIFRDVSFSISTGDRVHLFGVNGSGKSTLLGCIAGALEPDAGTIDVAGKRVTGTAGMFGKVGFLFQNPQRQLFENTVFEEVAFSLKRLKLPEAEVSKNVMEALTICEAEHLVGKLPLSISFGEQHRVALASVIAPRPEILLLDEPFAGLDVAQRQRLLKILGNLSENYKTTVILACHDPLPDPQWATRKLSVGDGNVGVCVL